MAVCFSQSEMKMSLFIHVPRVIIWSNLLFRAKGGTPVFPLNVPALEHLSFDCVTMNRQARSHNTNNECHVFHSTHTTLTLRDICFTRLSTRRVEARPVLVKALLVNREGTEGGPRDVIYKKFFYKKLINSLFPVVSSNTTWPYLMECYWAQTSAWRVTTSCQLN